jgi:hypothetical protein
MTNTTLAPLENAYKTVLTASIDAVTTTIIVDVAPSITVPAGKKIPAVLDPKNNFREVVFITNIAGSTLTVERGGPDYDGGPSTANAHSAGSTIVITNPFNIFKDYADAIDSKLDNDGGNPTTTWDLDVSGSNFRFRLDVGTGDMLFTDDNQAEVSLSTLAAAAGVDDKAKVSAADTTSSYLATKIVAGTGGAVAILNPGGNETLEIGLDPTGAGVSDHEIYTPAFLTGGNAPEIVVAIWDSVSDGAFSITIDGAVREITGLNFQVPAVISMAEVATVIQVGIRAVTGSNETCTWSGTEFVITSALTTVASAVTVTSTIAVPAGTDISGAGAAYMDCDAGSTAVASAAVLDPTADAGSLVVLAASGNINGALVDANTLGLTAKGSLATASDATTKTELTVGADGSALVADSTAPGGIAWASAGTNMLFVDTASYVHLGTVASSNTIYTVPGGTLGTNGGLRIKVFVNGWYSGNADWTKIGITYGAEELSFTPTSDGTTNNPRGIADFQIVGTGATNTQAGMATILLSNNGSGATYEGQNANDYVYSFGHDNAMAVDSTIDQDIVLIGDGAGGTEGWTVTQITIERI